MPGHAWQRDRRAFHTHKGNEHKILPYNIPKPRLYIHANTHMHTPHTHTFEPLNPPITKAVTAMSLS